jgi:Ca-activated chloride channel family protein
VEDLETQIAAGGDQSALEAIIERIGLKFQIATRLTSWVAITEEAMVDPRDPMRRVRVPQNLPHGLSVEGLGLRAALPHGMVTAHYAGSAGMVSVAKAGMVSSRSATIGAPPPPGMIAPPLGRASMGAPRAPAGGPPPAVRAPTPTGAPPPPKAMPARQRMAREEEKSRVSGVVDRVRDFFKGKDEKPREEDDATIVPERAMEPAESPAQAGPRTGWSLERKVRGRVTARGDQELVLELTVEDLDLAWAPEASVVVVFADGTTVTASVAQDRTTRSMTIAVGATVRIVLSFTTKIAKDPTEVRVPLALGSLVIEL